MHPESLHHEQQQQQQTFSTPGYQDSLFMNDFQFESEMGPALDLNTFPPTMGPPQDESGGLSGLTMDSVLSNGFWDNVLVPGTSLVMPLFVLSLIFSQDITTWMVSAVASCSELEVVDSSRPD